MPLHRKLKTVAITLIAETMLPMPADQQAENPVVRAVPAREGAARQRRIGKPAHIRRRTGPCESRRRQIAEIEQHPAEKKHPEAEGVQTGKGHIARADHQRHQVVHQPGDDRHAHQEDHRRTVHGEETVEGARANKIVIRQNQLHADNRSQ